MPRYRKKPIVVVASQWNKLGDHEEVVLHAAGNPQESCLSCHKPMGAHGNLLTLEGLMLVCPGDWIIKGIRDEFYACKPDVFEITYEMVSPVS